MQSKKYIIIGYYLKYLILLSLFKLIWVFQYFDKYFIVYIPLSYLVVKYTFIYPLEKNKYTKKDYLLPVIIGYTILNLIFRMHLLYDICIIVFLLVLKDKNTQIEQDTSKYIKEYYEKKNK